MLVFTLTNNVTDEVWVGTCKDSCEERFTQLKNAMSLGIKAQIYKDLRDYGAKNFTVDDFAMANDREELAELFHEALDTYGGLSLQGVKTSLRSPTSVKAPPARSRAVASAAVQKVKKKPVKEKISKGRTNNAAKEKLIKERMAEEKVERDMIKRQQERAQADEMAKIIARLDARGSTLAKR